MISNDILSATKRIQECWICLHNINKYTLMKKLHHNRSYDYFVFHRHNLKVLYSLMAAEGHLFKESDTTILLFGIQHHSQKIVLSVLDSLCHRISKRYTPLYGLMFKYNISINGLAKKLKVSNADVCNNLIRTHLQLNTIKHIARVCHFSTYHLAQMYGYQSDYIHYLQKRQQRKKSNQVGKYLRGLRKARHLTQIQVAKKLHTGQSEITAMENWRVPGMQMLIRCARLYTIPLKSLLSRCTGHISTIEYRSLCFRLAELRVKFGCTVKDVARRAHLKFGYVQSLSTYKSHKSVANPWLLQRIIEAFHISPDYFKGCYISTFTKTFEHYKEHTDLSKYDFGYRYNKVRCQNWMSYSDVAKLLHVSEADAQELTTRHSVKSYTLKRIIHIFPKEKNYLSYLPN